MNLAVQIVLKSMVVGLYKLVIWSIYCRLLVENDTPIMVYGIYSNRRTVSMVLGSQFLKYNIVPFNLKYASDENSSSIWF